MIKTFYFNDLRTCCYVLYDESGECAVVDPGCCTESEKNRLVKFIEENSLTPVMMLITHGHFDHVMGCGFVSSKWGVPMYMNSIDLCQTKRAPVTGAYFGYTFDAPPSDPVDLKDGETVTFGNTTLKVFETPGHSEGGVIYYNEKEKYVLTGDSLFAGSIGRTDLPEGDYDKLMNSLSTKIMVLPPDTDVYPGHGPATTIAAEAASNPFLEPIR